MDLTVVVFFPVRQLFPQPMPNSPFFAVLKCYLCQLSKSYILLNLFLSFVLFH